MKRFTEFFKEEYLVLESIEYVDRTLFTRIINEEFASDENELAKLDVELSNPESAKKYLNNEEEIELIKKYKADPNSKEGLDARNEVIINKMKFINLLVSKAVSTGRISSGQAQDATNNAVLYLIRAIDLYDISKGVPFTAYAKQWILAGITNPFNPRFHSSISSDIIGKETKYGNIGLSSLDTPITAADSDDKAMTLGDTIADTNPNTSPYDQLDEKDIRAKLGVFLKKLSDREATAIKLRFSTKPDGSQRTFAEIGKELGLTSMGAKLLIDRTLTKLKEFAKDEAVQ